MGRSCAFGSKNSVQRTADSGQIRGNSLWGKELRKVKKILKFLNPGDMIEDVFPRLISRKQLGLYRHEGFWYGMDTYRDFLFLNDLWEKDPKWKIWT